MGNPDRSEYFTKHLFRTGVECPTKLFYKARNFPEHQQSVPFIRHAVFNKHLLITLAQTNYPSGKAIDGASISDKASLTSDYLQRDTAVIFNAVFTHQKMMARLPIVVKKGDELTVFHFQTKAFNTQKHRLINNQGKLYPKWRTYLLDFAYQMFNIKQNFDTLKLKPVLVLPEKRGVAHSNNLPMLLNTKSEIAPGNQELLVKIDVEKHISTIWNDASFAREYLPKPSFVESLQYFRDTYFELTKVSPQIGSKCKHCEFRLEEGHPQKSRSDGFNQCWKGSQNHHIFDLIGPGINKWMEQGVYAQEDIDDQDILPVDALVNAPGRFTEKMRQYLQIHKNKGSSVPEEIIRPALFQELDRWEYPLHFLDFEAGNYAIPVRKNRSPYHLVIFQFSCHTLHKDGSCVHHQWIDDFSNDYTNFELVRQLQMIPAITEGTIVQYSNFERHALKTIRKEVLDAHAEVSDAQNLIKWLDGIIQRGDSYHPKAPFMVDLSRIVKHFYYNRAMENSLSVKDVLRVVMQNSNYLKQHYSKPYSSRNFTDITWWQSDGEEGALNPYALLSNVEGENIQRGTEAMVVYGKLISQKLPLDEVKKFQDALLRYCELDTLAMVMIYQHWIHEAKFKGT